MNAYGPGSDEGTPIDLEHPSPAAPEGCEDEGQRFGGDMSDSEMSDTNPAGLDRYGPLKRHSRTSRNSRSDNLEKPLTVRLSVADREAIWDRARVLGVKPSAWARGVLLDGLDARRSNVDRLHAAAAMKPDPQLAAAVEQVRRVGGNLNQSVKRGLVTDTPLLEAVLAALDETRAALGDRTHL